MTDVPPLAPLYFESQLGQVEVAFYLPNPPILPSAAPSHWQINTETAIDEVIAINGNHWRKIFTIMAKLCQSQSPSTKAWQGLRKTLFVGAGAANSSNNALSRRLHFLSAAHESSGYATNTTNTKARYQLDPKAKWHIICGLEAQTKLGLIEAGQSRALDDQAKVRLLSIAGIKSSQGVNTAVLTPYLDYRQFPNHLIEQVHALLHSSNE